MHAAFAAKLNSGCISRQVGAVVTDSSYSIKAVGWNDAPRGQVPCLLRNTSHALNKKWDEIAYSKFELGDDTFRAALSKTPLGKLAQEHTNGRNITYCFKAIYNGIKKDKNQVHTRSLHAEENAFLQISRSGGQGLDGGCLFTTASPCELCAKKAYQLGIKQIYYIDPVSYTHLDVYKRQIYKCIDKALAAGVGAGLKDAYHRPHEPEITDEAKAWVVSIACTKPKDHGLAAELWSISALARFVCEGAEAAGHPRLAQAGKSTVWRILN